VPDVASAFVIEVDGTRLPATVDVAAVAVEDHLHLPDSFVVTLRDATRQGLTDAGARIGSKVTISVLQDAAPAPTVLLKGEVTALEAEIHQGTSFTHIRGYDESHRLLRGRVTESYRDASYTDIAQRVAERHGLQTGTIEGPAPSHQHVTQANENDWEFLRRLAAEAGFEVTVSDGKLNFHPPMDASAAPGRGDLTTEDPLQLLVGSNILELRATVTSAEQVSEVEARGWDPQNKQAVVATATARTDTISNGLTPGGLAGTFPGPRLVNVDTPIATDAEADSMARALAEEVAAVFAEMEGMARGNPRLRAGVGVRIGLLGAPFDGTYVLTTTRHTYDQYEGYVTTFAVSGRAERSMLGLTGGANESGRIAGVVPALVDDVDDPNRQGRVRLKYPWMADQYVSDWSRVAHAGAGPDRGWLIMPEVGDEVLVAFEQGDVRRPYVISGLYNGVDEAVTGPDPFLDGSSHAVNNRLFTSRSGHQLVFVDADQHGGVMVRTGDGGLSITLNQSDKKLELVSSGDITIKADGSIKIEAQQSFEVKAQSVAMEGQTEAKVKGAQVSVEGSGPVAIKGQPVQLN